MKILFYQWHSFMNKGIERALAKLGIEYDVLFYQQKDWEHNDGIIEQLQMALNEKKYDFVFSVNYAPLVSEVCNQKDMLYVSWVYDAPIHIRDISSMKNSCNRIFFFDRVQAENYCKQDINAYHMPLAGDVMSFAPKQITCQQYQSDITLMGKLYKTDYEYYCSPLDKHQKGYLDGIINAQSKVYGGYLLGELLDEKLLADINEKYQMASNGTVSISKVELEYMMACEITSRERYMALALLSKYFDVHLYSTEKDERLINVQYKGYADYYTQMSLVFQASKINLNISLKIIQSGIPLRVFDVLASGGFLLTNFQAEMPEYFSLGEDFVVYESIGDMVEKANYYLQHDEERERIALHGYETIKKNYTFEQQLAKLIKIALG